MSEYTQSQAPTDKFPGESDADIGSTWLDRAVVWLGKKLPDYSR